MVTPASFAGPKKFFRFETLTYVPFDRVLIDVDLMSADEIAWLDAYHSKVLADVAPHTPAEVQGWLQEACAPLRELVG